MSNFLYIKLWMVVSVLLGSMVRADILPHFIPTNDYSVSNNSDNINQATDYMSRPSGFLFVEEHKVAVIIFITSIVVLVILLIFLISYIGRAKYFAKKADNERCKLAAVWNSLPVRVAILDREGNYLMVNRIRRDEHHFSSIFRTFDYDTAIAVLRTVEDTLGRKSINSLQYEDPSSGRMYSGVCKPLDYTLFDKETVLWVSTDITQDNYNKRLTEKSKQRLEYSQKIAHLGSWEGDIDGKVWVSEEFCRILNLPQPEEGYRDMREIRKQVSLPDSFFEKIRDCAVNNSSFSDVIRLNVGKKAEAKVINAIITSSIDKDNGLICATGVMHDVTSQVSLNEELNKRETILLQASKAARFTYWIYDPVKHGFHLYNSSNIFSNTTQEDFQTIDQLAETVHPDDIVSYKKRATGMLEDCATNSYSFNYRRIIDSKVKYYSVKAQSEFDAKSSQLKVTGITIDVTREEEEKILEKQRKLELERTEAKASFLASMSHEIRTPLNVLMGMAELLKETGLNELQSGYLGKMQKASNRLLDTINDILDYSKIDSKRLKLEHEEFAFVDTICDTCGILIERAEAKNIDMSLRIARQIPRLLIGDPLRISQVLTNLVSNAIKFTPNGGSILVEVFDKSVEEDVIIQIDVIDTGIGIDEDKIPYLFEEFTQADQSTTRQFGGSGLGLAICRKLVELMGGEISVVSRRGYGSRFSFTVKLDLVPNFTIEKYDFSGQGAVVLSESETFSSIMDSNLSYLGFDVSIVKNEREVVHLMRQDKDKFIKILIFDNKSLGEKSIEIAKKVKDENLIQTPRLVLATTFSDSMKGEYCEIFDSVMSRPINPHLLDSVVDRLINGRDAQSTNGADSDFSMIGVRVMVAENEPVHRELLGNLLRNAGAEVVEVFDGRQAVETAESDSFDLLVLDFEMPYINGLDVVKILRQSGKPGLKTVPMVITSEHSLEYKKTICLEAGADCYLAKPFVVENVFDGLAELLPRNVVNRKVSQVPASDRLSIMGTIAGVNVEKGLDYCNGSRDLYISNLQKFASNNRGKANEIAESLKSGDIQAAIFNLHSLKGASSAIAADSLYECCRQLEAAGKDGGEYATLLSVFSEQIDGILDSIDSMGLKAKTEIPATAGTVEEFFQILGDLRDSSKRFDAVSCSELVLRLKSKRWATENDSDIQEIERMISSYQFTGALSIIDNILREN